MKRTLDEIGMYAMAAKPHMQLLGTTKKNQALEAVANALNEKADYLIAENEKDMQAGKEAGMHQGLLDRLLLTIRQQRIEREFEETMHRTSSGIDSSDACRGEYNMFLFGIFADVTQECRFPCTRFPGQENRLTRILNQVQGVLKRCVIGVYAHNQIIPKCFIALLMPSSSMGAVT